MSRRAWRRGVVGTLAAVMAVVVPGDPHAVEYRVQAQTVGDAYQLVTSTNALLNRRRIHQYLGFGAHDLLSDGSNALNVSTLFRFDADFGLSDTSQGDVPTLKREQLSIQYAWVDGRDLGGLLDFRLGRQMMADALDYLMLDGAVMTLKTPWHVGLELQAGLEVKDGLSDLNASSHELDGVRIIAGVEANDRPTWVIGGALVTEGLQNTRARLGYRRLFSGSEVDSEKVGGAFYQRVADALHVSALASYDLFNARFDRLQAGLRWQASAAFDVEGEYVRLLPSFDADSIFNIFTAFALNDGNLRLRFHPSADDRVYVGGMMRFFGNESGPEGTSSGDVDTVVKAYGAMGGYYRRFGRDASVHADLSWEGGYGGDRVLGDLGGTWSLVPGEWELDGRITVVSFADALQPNLDGLSVGYQLGGRYLVDTRAAVQLMVEQNFSRLQPSNLRVFAVVDLDLWL